MTRTERNLAMKLELAVGMLTLLREGKTFTEEVWNARMGNFQRTIDHVYERWTPPYPSRPK